MTSPTAPGIDPDAVRRWLDRHGHEPDGPVRLRRVGLGQSNLTYRATDRSGRAWVVRRPPLGELLHSAHDVLREARILAALHPTPVPVPDVHGVAESGELGDAPAFVMSWVDGAVLDRMPLVEGLSRQLRGEIARSLARTLAAVHRVDLRATGLDDLASRAPYGPRQLRRWSAQWERSRTVELPALDKLTRRLTDAVGNQGRDGKTTTLVHGDFHLRNMITAPGSGEIVAVLDWELSTLGHPLADLGSLLAYWTQPGERGIDDYAPSTLPGFPTRAEMVAAYATASGRDTSAIGFWHALGLWKLAIIAQGVLRRAIDEPRNRATEGTPTTDSVARLVERAHAVADEAGI